MSIDGSNQYSATATFRTGYGREKVTVRFLSARYQLFSNRRRKATSNDLSSESVERFLAQPDIHQEWIDTYYRAENQAYYELVFDYIISILKPSKGSMFLDAGCGNCAHSIRLANRGFFVQAIDFSEAALEMARKNVSARGLQGKISITRENILALPFEDDTFKYVLCWGVLMHIPNVEKAISELARVLKPAGAIVISENNMHSLQSVILRNVRRFLVKGKRDVRNTPAGMEYWRYGPAEALLTREANIRWLIERFKSSRLTLDRRLADEFTEAYIRISLRPLRNSIHRFNKFWFKYVKTPYPAYGNIVILRKEE